MDKDFNIEAARPTALKANRYSYLVDSLKQCSYEVDASVFGCAPDCNAAMAGQSKSSTVDTACASVAFRLTSVTPFTNSS